MTDLESGSNSVCLGPSRLVVGHDDSEEDDLALEFTGSVYGHKFGWDNESPQRIVDVQRFRVTWRPVTNSQFYKFWSSEGKELVKVPASWRLIDGEVSVSSVKRIIVCCQDYCIWSFCLCAAAAAVAKKGQDTTSFQTHPLNIRIFFD